MTPMIPTPHGPTKVEFAPTELPEQKQPYTNRRVAVRSVPLKMALLAAYPMAALPNHRPYLPGDSVGTGVVVGWQPVLSTGRNSKCTRCGKKRKRCKCVPELRGQVLNDIVVDG